MTDDYVVGGQAEIVVRSDGKAVWVYVDGGRVLRIKVERVVVEDQRETTDTEVLASVATELSELRLKASQYDASNRRKANDARAGRRYSEAHRYDGRQFVWEQVTAQLDKIIREYRLKERE